VSAANTRGAVPNYGLALQVNVPNYGLARRVSGNTANPP